jgi:hypothetical protein
MSITGDKYLAGLWKQTLRKDLLWEMAGEFLSARPMRYRAPSWSWASVDARSGIVFRPSSNSIQSTIENKIEAADCTLFGEDVTGAVISGYIRFEASIRMVHLRYVCTYYRITHRSRHFPRFLVEIFNRGLGGLKHKSNICNLSICELLLPVSPTVLGLAPYTGLVRHLLLNFHMVM